MNGSTYHQPKLNLLQNTPFPKPFKTTFGIVLAIIVLHIYKVDTMGNTYIVSSAAKKTLPVEFAARSGIMQSE